MVIRAIETIYDGRKFRSRLEARFAVFFNLGGIPYSYELEGYELEGVGRYLPDFWLPEHQLWFEVKPASPTPIETAKAAALAVGTDYPLVMSESTDFKHMQYRYFHPPDGRDDNPGHVGIFDWVACAKCGTGTAVAQLTDQYGTEWMTCDIEHAGFGRPSEVVTGAHLAALQARF